MRPRPIRGYAKLTAAERFRLAVRAQARGDEQEVSRLQQTCPRKTYSALDDGFVEKVRVSQSMTLAWAVDLSAILGQLDAVTVLEDSLKCGNAVRMLLGRRAIMLMREFDHVCRSYTGLSGEVMLAAWCLPTLENYRALTADIECANTEVMLDEELVEALNRAELPF